MYGLIFSTHKLLTLTIYLMFEAQYNSGGLNARLKYILNRAIRRKLLVRYLRSSVFILAAHVGL